MAKNTYTPKVNQFPLTNVTKMPLGQAIHTVGQKSGLNPQQAAVAAAMSQAGMNPTKVIIRNPRDPNRSF